MRSPTSFTLFALIWIGFAQSVESLNSKESLNARFFRWHFKKDMSLNLIKRGTITVYKNNKLIEIVKQNNIVNLVAESVQNDSCFFHGFFKTFTSTTNEVLILKDEFFSQFHMTRTGVCIVPSNQIQPSIQSIPTFPEKRIRPGDTWQASCSYLYYQFDPSFILTTNANYTYLSNARMQSDDGQSNVDVAVIKVTYQFMENIKDQLNATAPNQVARIIAQNTSILYWDVKANILDSQTDHLKQMIIFNNGDKLRWEMRFNSKYDVTYPLTKETFTNIQEQIEKTLGRDLSSGVVQSYIDKQGIHLTLGEIFFDHNSHVLVREKQVLLDKILPILNQYSDYEILIEGHTDSTGTKNYNYELSINRAESVANYLKKSGNLKHRKLYIMGHGEDRPLFGNDTEEQRQKNRRVEIILKQSGE